jgi:hypothetical protein
MTVRDLERALLARLVTGQINQMKTPSWSEVNSWKPEERAHAVANGLITIKIVLDSAKSLKGGKEVIQSYQKDTLQRLNDLGWSGRNVGQFRSDFLGLRRQLKKVLPKEKWKKYFL